MAFAIKDEIFSNLYYAQEAAKEFVEMSNYDWIFESVENGNKQMQAEKNDKVMEKTDGFLQKAITGIKKLIAQIRDTISNFFTYITLSKEEKVDFKKMKAEIEANPEFSGRKIRIKDYRNIKAQYESMIKELESEIRNVKKDEKTNIDKTMKKASDFLKSGVKLSVGEFGISAALKVCEGNRNWAKIINRALTMSETAMDELEKSVGKKDAELFRKKTAQYSKLISLRGMCTRIYKKATGQIHESIKDCVVATANEVKSGSPKFWKKIIGNEKVSPTVKATVKTVAGEGIKAGAKVGAEKVGQETAKVRNKMADKIKSATSGGQTSVDDSAFKYATGYNNMKELKQGVKNKIFKK